VRASEHEIDDRAFVCRLGDGQGNGRLLRE